MDKADVGFSKISHFIGATTWFRFLNNCADQRRNLWGVIVGFTRSYRGCGPTVQGLRGTFSGPLNDSAAKWQLGNEVRPLRPVSQDMPVFVLALL